MILQSHQITGVLNYYTRVVTTESFIAEVRLVYGNHYDYGSTINYMNIYKGNKKQ